MSALPINFEQRSATFSFNSSGRSAVGYRPSNGLQAACFNIHLPTVKPIKSAWPIAERCRRSKRVLDIKVKSQAAAASDDGSKKSPNFFQRLFAPLANFGYGRTSFWQGGVGLFILTGLGVALLLITWAKNGLLGPKGQGYQAIFEFPSACGITVGTPVRIRGVPVGSVLNVKPSLERVEVLAEIKDATTVIPRNSLIEANQSGLIAEPLLDITPQHPIPDYTANPLDDMCEVEGKVVCHMGRIKGVEGVSMDELVHNMQKATRIMEARGGVEKTFEMIDEVAATLDEAKPLLSKAVSLADEIRPILTELRSSNLVGNIEALTRVAAEAADDINKLQKLVLDEENVKALRGSVSTLSKTLDHISNITGDVGGLTSDRQVQANLKELIQALSRLIAD